MTRSLSFDIRTPRDLLKILHEDLADLEREPLSARHAIHGALLAWHLHEWLWAVLLKGDHAKQAAVFGKPFKTRANFADRVRSDCPDLEIMQGVAEGTKHMGTTAQVADTDPSFGAATYGSAVYGSSRYGDPGELAVILTGGSPVPFLPTLRRVVEFWDRTLTACGG